MHQCMPGRMEDVVEFTKLVTSVKQRVTICCTGPGRLAAGVNNFAVSKHDATQTKRTEKCFPTGDCMLSQGYSTRRCSESIQRQSSDGVLN
jgi:hypothetical protein